MGVETVEASCERVCEVLGQYPLDIPFTALYLQESEQRFPCVAQSAGIPEGMLPAVLTDSDSPWPLQQVLRNDSGFELTDLPRHGISIPAGPWPEPVHRAMILP